MRLSLAVLLIVAWCCVVAAQEPAPQEPKPPSQDSSPFDLKYTIDVTAVAPTAAVSTATTRAAL